MQLSPDFAVALGKLVITFASILLFLRLKWKLWQAVTAGCAVVAVMALAGGTPLKDLLATPITPLKNEGFIFMQIMIFGIMLLSGLQEATGQSVRLVAALDRCLRWPRLRLVIFPALVGFLPMPGGALFSCPMLDAAAHGLNISQDRKALINYWFRHIWEVAWPLYPGFILTCSLIDVPPQTLMSYTFPLVFCNMALGWFFFIRNIELPKAQQEPGAAAPGPERPWKAVFYESLPISITIFGAIILGAVLSRLAPDIPSQVAFIFSLAVANAVAFLQGRKELKTPVLGLVLNRRTLAMMLLIYTIYVFKDVIEASGIVADMSHAGGSLAALGLITIVLPLICAMLTGVMVGYVAASFPIVLGIIAEAGMQAYTLPFVVLAIAAGQAGQLITPLHVCVVVTCEYYRVRFNDIWRSILKPTAVLLACGLLWVGFLFARAGAFGS